MRKDKFNQTVLSELEALELLYSGKITNFDNLFVEEKAANQFNNSIDLNKENFTKIFDYKEADISLEEFDRLNQLNWFMPEEYKNLDIEQWLLNKCHNSTQEQRVLEELELFNQFDMINVLRFLKYLVDYMRANNLVWGLGRGSSVASYCLYLIGIHKVDSIKYDLDMKEFLK